VPLRRLGIGMAQDYFYRFCWHVQAEQHRSYAAAERLPAFPCGSQLGPDYAGNQIILVQRELFLIPAENPFRITGALLVCVEHFAQGRYNWNLGLGCRRFGFAYVGTPDGAANTQILPS
jgi:hypothetical protein